jgi:hypothetical protein
LGSGARGEPPTRGLPSGRIGAVGHAELVEGVIEQLELPDPEDLLAYLQGHYRSVGHLPDHG